MKGKGLLWKGTLVMLLLMVLSGCGADSGQTSEGVTEPVTAVVEGQMAPGTEVLSDVLPADYEDALSARNQLALGTLRLEGTEHAVTPEQAKTLAFLWQGLKTLATDSTTASEENAALQQQIAQTMTVAQLEAIRGLRLTSDDLNAFYEERGIPLPTVDPDNPDAEPGSQRGKTMTEEERAARRAAREAAGGAPVEGGGGMGAARRDALMDAVITVLLERAG